MFSEVLQNYSWQDTTDKIMSMTGADVERALAKNHLDLDDFMAL